MASAVAVLAQNAQVAIQFRQTTVHPIITQVMHMERHIFSTALLALVFCLTQLPPSGVSPMF
jgi:hypothetical protein